MTSSNILFTLSTKFYRHLPVPDPNTDIRGTYQYATFYNGSGPKLRSLCFHGE